MDADGARRLAEAELARWNDSLTPDRIRNPRATTHDPEDEYLVTEVVEHSRAWIVRFATRRWVRTQSVMDQVVGTCPFVVDKAAGELHVYGSGQYAQFAAWLDQSAEA